MDKQIIISDMEAISPFGNNLAQVYESTFVQKKLFPNKINHIENLNFYKQGYHVKTRIDMSGQLCIHVTAGLVADEEDIKRDRIGLITVSKYGCPNSRAVYLNQLQTLEDKQYASPKDFVNSICNIPNALATIECGIHGFANHYMGMADAALIALWQAGKCVKEAIADKMILTAFHVITEQQAKILEKSGLRYNYINDTASGLKIQVKSNELEGKAVFEVLGGGFAADGEVDKAVDRAIGNAIKDAGIKAEDIQFILSNANSVEEFRRYEKKAIKARVSYVVPTLMLKCYVGECFAAYPFLALGIMSKLCGSYLPVNFPTIETEEHLSYNKIEIYKNSIFMVITYGYTGSASVLCLKYC